MWRMVLLEDDDVDEVVVAFRDTDDWSVRYYLSKSKKVPGDKRSQ